MPLFGLNTFVLARIGLGWGAIALRATAFDSIDATPIREVRAPGKFRFAPVTTGPFAQVQAELKAPRRLAHLTASIARVNACREEFFAGGRSRDSVQRTLKRGLEASDTARPLRRLRTPKAPC